MSEVTLLSIMVIVKPIIDRNTWNKTSYRTPGYLYRTSPTSSFLNIQNKLSFFAKSFSKEIFKNALNFSKQSNHSLKIKHLKMHAFQFTNKNFMNWSIFQINNNWKIYSKQKFSIIAPKKSFKIYSLYWLAGKLNRFVDSMIGLS